MIKKLIIIIIFIIVLLAIFYFKPMEVSKLIAPLSSNNLPLKIETEIFFSAQSNKKFDITNEESIKEMMTIIENIKVRKLIISPKSYKPNFKKSYMISLYGQNNTFQHANILSSKYIQINHIKYKIIDAPHLSNIYDIIILDQPERSLDKFYYYLLENK